MYLDDTLLVPKLEIATPERDFAETYAPVKRRQWPWVFAAAIVLGSALLNPLVPIDQQARLSSSAQQLRQSLSAP